MPEFYDSKQVELKKRIAQFATSQVTANLKTYNLDPQEAAQLLWDTCGNWVFPWEAQYEALRTIFYANYKNVKPSAIAVCQNIKDLRCALAYFRGRRLKDEDFEFTPRSGGHSTAGYSTLEGGVMLDLRSFNQLAVDTRNELVHVGPGVQFRDFYKTLENYGRFTPAGICPEVRAGGYMQGGGYGFASRMFGMNCDNVESLLVVLQDGRCVEANQSVNADLFWAMRGGTGNNFGIVTQITYKTYKVRQFGAISMHWRLKGDIEAMQGAQVLALMQSQFMGSNNDRRFGYMTYINFLEDENDSTLMVPYLQMRTMYQGELGTGAEILNQLIQTPGCVVHWEDIGADSTLNSRLMGYEEHDNNTQFANTEVQDLPNQEKQSRFFIKPLGVEGWKTLIDHMRTAPSLFTSMPELNIEPGGAAINDTKRGDNGYIHREDDFNGFLNVYWHDDKEVPEKAKAFKFLDQWLDMTKPWTNGAAYQNYPKPYVTDYSKRYWAEYYPVFCVAKSKYDPNNLFRFQQGVGADGLCPVNSLELAKNLVPSLADTFEQPIEYMCNNPEY
ncbi:MAG: FAD-dependent oxidoreductase [Psychrosphaera sp.]|nr:FAD-dependent oxidoreductase [Psychrosphaera sp.]